jgi:transcriptional regulator with XRE-family HTH domain
MPRRLTPSPACAKVGARIRALRVERGLSLEDVANAGQISKGHLSSVEHGLAAITVETMMRIAQGLDVLPMDLLAFPEEHERARIGEIVRQMHRKELPKVRRELAARVKNGVYPRAT